jgi:DNA-binding transcriptional LysR family regulator
MCGRLEAEAGRRLFVRDTRSVTLTADGQAMLALGGGILEANERARQYFAGSNCAAGSGSAPPRISSRAVFPRSCETSRVCTGRSPLAASPSPSKSRKMIDVA